MGRSILSHFFVLSNTYPRSISSLPCGVHLSKCFSRTGAVQQQRRVRRGENFRCLCSVAVSEPSTSAASSSSVKKRIVSGVQPTGSIHLGNYLGAIKNWIDLQNTYETLFFIVDLHAASVFVQSHVRAHVELMWLLSSATPIGWLNRMIQFKEKSRKAVSFLLCVTLIMYLSYVHHVPVYQNKVKYNPEKLYANKVRILFSMLMLGMKMLGFFFTYPVLMASDILLYQVPEPLIPPTGARVMSLLSKMSKSAPSDQSRINLLDPKDVISNKIKRCKTDSFPGLEFDNPERPECNNLLSVYQLITSKTKQEVVEECQDMNWGTFKTLLTDALVDHLHPIQTRYAEITSDTAYLDNILAEGASKATAIADVTLSNVYQAMGFLQR
ncbi:UNVERIFIED_CONTAM: Tryptophan--tRNA ligase, chloroplastic/mitochondrial [Sesamum latifolium]|uniref:tryptophan--tRNA ligase n=1 Tax=Sesamum latifolium TaxID=2727402 RepID=A0AAW2X0W7_9LAMI